MASFFSLQENTTQLGSSLKDPAWFQNSARRVIPNHLVSRKRLAFQLSASSNSKRDTKSSQHSQTGPNSKAFNSTDFNLISFGSTTHADSQELFLTGQAHDTTNSFANDDLPLYNENEDLPPARSLYDLTDEVIISLNKLTPYTESFINKDPTTFVNAFHQKSDILKTSPEEEAAKNLNPLQNSESAILVFGYPEAISSQVIAYFSEFGTILEQFEALKSLKNVKANILLSLTTTGAFDSSNGSNTRPDGSSSAPFLPIFSGNSWVKITYDNPASALDALQESGSVFNGVLIGVVPYTKDAIEKLQKRKLSLLEDIGGGFLLLPHQETHNVDKEVIGDSNDIQSSYIKRLDVKDGTGLFLSANATGSKGQAQGDKTDERKLGLFASASKYFFGFHDL